MKELLTRGFKPRLSENIAKRAPPGIQAFGNAFVTSQSDFLVFGNRFVTRQSDFK